MSEAMKETEAGTANADTRPQEAPAARGIGALLRRLLHACGVSHGTTVSSDTIDLADWPDRYDPAKVATFYEACSEEFPGQRDIYLPSAMEEYLQVSQLPVRSELQLLKRLRPGCRVILSIRTLLGKSCQISGSLERIIFEW